MKRRFRIKETIDPRGISRYTPQQRRFLLWYRDENGLEWSSHTKCKDWLIERFLIGHKIKYHYPF